MAAYKRCTDCGKTKAKAEFRMSGPRYLPYCRLCQNARLREARAK